MTLHYTYIHREGRHMVLFQYIKSIEVLTCDNHVKAKFEEEKSEKENEASNLRPDNHVPFCSVLKGHLWKYTRFENRFYK